jgi:hypothetical protein
MTGILTIALLFTIALLAKPVLQVCSPRVALQPTACVCVYNFIIRVCIQLHHFRLQQPGCPILSLEG